MGCLSSTGTEVKAFGSHCPANFHQILDCFVPNLKLNDEDSENIKADHLNTVIFNEHQIKHMNSFWEHMEHVSPKFDIILLPHLQASSF